MRTERGATMVEAAIVAPIVLFLFLSLMDAGLYFGQKNSLSYATRKGAHAASVTGANGLADYDVLDEVHGALAFIPDSNIERIVVFHANGWDDQPSSTCKSGTPVSGVGVGDCNVYYTSDFSWATTKFGDGGWPNDDNYPAWLRNDHRGSTDFVGVWIQARCSCLGTIFQSQSLLESTTVMRLEAKQV